MELTLRLRPFLSLKKRYDKLWNCALHCNLFRMQWFCNLPVWNISQPVAHILFVYTPIQFEVCLVAKQKIPSLPIISNAKAVHKSFSTWQNWFLSTLKQFAVCMGDKQNHPLTFDVLYWAEKSVPTKWCSWCLFDCCSQFFAILPRLYIFVSSYHPFWCCCFYFSKCFHSLIATCFGTKSYLFNFNF